MKQPMRTCIERALSTALIATLWLAGSAGGQDLQWKMLFANTQDVVDTWGKLDIAVTPVDFIRRDVQPTTLNNGVWPALNVPGTKLVGCFPLADGSWEVFSQEWQPLAPAVMWYDNPAKWKLMRGITTNGVTFSNVETVIAETTGPWTRHLVMAYNPDAKEYLMLKLRTDSIGYAYHAYFSSNGKQWQAYSGNPLFYDGDALTVFWSTVLKKYILTSKSFQRCETKHYIDHSATRRRVLILRSSPDGRNWTPSESLQPPVWTDAGVHPDNLLTTPDANDPPNLEYYSGNGFWYHDRAYMMVLNYAPHPLLPNEHGEELDNEWWVSTDGLQWERPARGVNALAAFLDGQKRQDMPPMIIGGKLLWLQGSNLVGLAEDRISGVSARAPSEFSTKLFTMPSADLLLNAAVPALERPWLRRSPQPYLMVAVLDAQGNVIPGFERNKCVIWDGTSSPTRDTQVDTLNRPLLWGIASARQLAGSTIRLRFYFGGSTIYAVTALLPQQVAPAITTPPANVTVYASQPATFSVTASGTPPLFYQWYTNSTPISGATGTSYTTPATTTNDSGRPFTVTVTNRYGAVTSSVATLTVNPLPVGTVVATGGTVTNYTLNGLSYRAHIFTTLGATNLNVTVGGDVEVLVVGGGGGGGRGDNGDGAGGGGGAGGLIYTNLAVVVSNYAVMVGTGGSTNTAAPGSNSFFGSLTALGGGYGGRMVSLVATNGGSGGGGFGRSGLTSAGSATQPSSSYGGYGSSGGVGGGTGGGGGGGGGAGSAGVAGGSGSYGGNGGAGFTNSISGVSRVYAGGGGGGSGASGQAAGTATGGGGAGGAYGQNNGINAVANTGGGGGGGAEATAISNYESWGGAGGSGIVIVRYVTGGGLDPFEAWRQTSFTSAQLTNAAISSATADPDEDGLNNEQEYLAGTNPTNALSCLVISAATNNPSTSGTFVLSWQSVSSKIYKVMAATNLMTGFTDLATNIQATPTVNVHTDSVGSAETKFYRVKLE